MNRAPRVIVEALPVVLILLFIAGALLALWAQ
jgi:hypothetical protein